MGAYSISEFIGLSEFDSSFLFRVKKQHKKHQPAEFKTQIKSDFGDIQIFLLICNFTIIYNFTQFQFQTTKDGSTENLNQKNL